MRAHCDETDDSDLIEEVMRRMLANGCLVSRRDHGVNGIGYHPATYILTHTGPAPALGKHEWIDIRNRTVESGSMCGKCRKLRAENFDQD